MVIATHRVLIDVWVLTEGVAPSGSTEEHARIGRAEAYEPAGCSARRTAKRPMRPGYVSAA
jgi:hypothetical protein